MSGFAAASLLAPGSGPNGAVAGLPAEASGGGDFAGLLSAGAPGAPPPMPGQAREFLAALGLDAAPDLDCLLLADAALPPVEDDPFLVEAVEADDALLALAALALPPGVAAAAGDAPVATRAGAALPAAVTPPSLGAAAAETAGAVPLPAEALAGGPVDEAIDAALASLRRGGDAVEAPAPTPLPSATTPAAFAVPAFASPASGRFAALADPAQGKPVRIDGGDFADGVGARLSWMAEHRVGRAEIRLSPPELGAIDVELQIDGKQVRAEFSSAHADVRQVLEAGLPRLREMLASQGLNLAHAGVGGEGGSGQSGRGETSPRHAGDAEPVEGAGAAPTGARILRASRLLDEYA